MPIFSGLELAQAVLAQKPDMPVSICTGFSEWVNRIEVARTGIRRVIVKPLLKKEIAAAIRKVSRQNL